MYEAIYGTSVPYLQGRTVLHKVYHVEPIVLMNPTQGILDRYNNTTLCCELMHINSIGLLNNISRHILFSTVSMNKIEKLRKLRMESIRSTSYTYKVVSISPPYMLTANVNNYRHKWLFLASV